MTAQRALARRNTRRNDDQEERMPFDTVNGVQLYWESSGSRSTAPMVLVHGSWADHQIWAPVAPALAQSFHVLTYDRRGHSESERPAGQGSVHDDVLDLAQLLESHDHAPAHVVGNSFGASIALRLAAQRPELVRSLTVHEPPLFALLAGKPDGDVMLAATAERVSAIVSLMAAGEVEAGTCEFMESIAFGPGAWASLPDETKRTFMRNAPTFLDEARDPDALDIDVDRLRRFRGPALLTQSDQSAAMFPAVVDVLARVLPHAEQHTFVGAGHVPHLSHPDLYVSTVKRFVQGLGD
jgi:pimeloyl-ACP methyl ester carboxylesterase